MARTDEQINLRVPKDLKDRIKQAASDNKRSINSEILICLEKHFGKSADNREQ